MSILMISDLHLSPEQPVFLDLLEKFIDTYIDASVNKLFILGDLFNLWIGDDIKDPTATRTLALLKQAATKTQVALMHGNRDFLLGEQFAKEIGATLHREDEVKIDIGSLPTLLLHGDTLCTDDIAYVQFRMQVRDDQFQKHFLSLPIPERIAKAAEMRSNSKESMASKDEVIMDVNQQAVCDRLNETACRLMIHGHTHRPAIHKLSLNDESCARIVLSDWKTNRGNFLRISNNIAELCFFDVQGDLSEKETLDLASLG